MAGSDVERARLFDLIFARSFAYGKGKFTLSSGRQSDIYFDLKPTLMHAEGSLLVAKAFLAECRRLEADMIGGLEMGAVPSLGTVAALSCQEGHLLHSFFVRKQPKGHGTRKWVEGLAPGETLSGKRVVIVDDVTTSGASVFIAVEKAREAGAVVESAISLVDRDEGATAYLAGEGVKLVPIFHAREFTMAWVRQR